MRALFLLALEKAMHQQLQIPPQVPFRHISSLLELLKIMISTPHIGTPALPVEIFPTSDVFPP